MSDEILSAARHLAETIRNSGLYREYRASLLKVQEQPALALRLQMFKRMQTEAEADTPAGQPLSFEKEKDISHRYTELVNNSDASLFLSNEGELLKTYTEVLNIIDNACEIELF